MTMHVLVYLIYNLINTFYIRYILGSFFDIKYDRIVTNGAFGLYFVLTSSVYLFIRIPALTFAVTLGCLAALTLIYRGSSGTKLLTAMIIIVGFVVIETMTGFAMNGLEADINFFSRFNDYAVLSFVFTSILFMLFARLITRFRNIGKTGRIGSFDWLNLMLIPSFSIALILLLISSNVEANKVIIIGVLILILDFSLFYLFDRLSLYYIEKEKMEVSNVQKRMYVNQIRYMNENMDKIRKINHDFNKHIVLIKEQINNGNNEYVMSYIDKIHNSSERGYNWSNSGNIAVDSIVNHYLNSLDPETIRIQSLVNIDKDIGINDVDITIILGNLLDNTVKALKDIDGKTKLYFNLETDKGVVFISIENSFKGDISLDRSGLPENSSKKSYGMKNIASTVEKYDGRMNIDFGNKLFSVDILLYQSDVQERKEIG